MQISKGALRSLLMVLLVSSGLLFLTIHYPESLRYIRLTQWFGFIGIGILYIYLLLDLSFKSISRKLLVPFTAFMLLHAAVAFFGEVGGLSGYSFLPKAFATGVIIGIANLITILVLVISRHVNRLNGRKRKMGRIFFHVMALLVVVHVLILGTHFENYETPLFRISFILGSVLFVAEFFVIDKFLGRKIKLTVPVFTVISTILVGLIGGRVFSSNPSSLLGTINMHGLQMNSMDSNEMNMTDAGFMARMNSMPTMKGDRTKRYTVNFDHPMTIKPNTDTLLSYTVFDAASGNQVGLFQLAYTKLMHMVVVDDQLQYFSHIHPSQNGERFIVSTQFPHEGRYHIYISFQPVGAIEQQFGFTLQVGPKNEEETKPEWSVDQDLTKTFGDVKVSLTEPHLISKKMEKGEQSIRFTLTNAATGEPLTNLSPYLAAFGHLVMINTRTYEYLHVHPTNISAPNPQDRSGPVIDFVPVSIFDPIHPGMYRLFAQFSPDGKLFASDFTVQVD